MTGLDLLRDEMIQRGCTKTQAQSLTSAVVLDILTKSGDKYQRIKEAEDEKSGKLSQLETEIARLENRSRELEWSIEDKKREYEYATEQLESIKEYVEEFNKKLTECESEEGRDAVRRAQLFVNSVNVESKYDNTAFIIGLSAILTDGKISAVTELRKINPKLFDGNHRTLGRY